jgi:hypothetical protein
MVGIADALCFPTTANTSEEAAMKTWISRTALLVISVIALAGCSSAVASTSQEQATSDDSAIYQPSARKTSTCDSAVYTCDQDGYPMLCDKEGNCRSNPAYDAYRYRQFAYGQLPSYNGANTSREFQPFPGVPIMNLSF